MIFPSVRYGSRTLVHDRRCEVDRLCKRGAPHVRKTVDVEVPLATRVRISEVE
jgi:hypothetical protein